MPKKVYKGKVLDARPDRLDLRDREYRPPLRSLPDAWPLREDYKQLFKIYTDNKMVLDQGKDGACTGFGLAAVINYLFWRDLFDASGGEIRTQDIEEKKVSSKMLYHMARVYDEWKGEDYEGSSCRGAMKGWHRHGVCNNNTWPHEIDPKDKTKYPSENWSQEAVKNPLGAYYRINKDSIVDMQAAIREVGAIYCSATIHEGWWIDETKELKIIEHSANKVGGHAFAILGYNEDGFVVQNSWGDEWGHLGFAVLKYKDWVENGSDAWVAVRGARLNLSSSPHTFSNSSLQTIGADYTEDNSQIIRTFNYPYKHKETVPWSEEEAYKHSLVIANDGRPKLTIVSEADPEKSAETICHTYIKAWMKKSSKNRKIVVYAHGGLNDEDASIDRIRIMAPYFKANGIYPLFVTWKTGFLESISNQIQEKVDDIFSGAGIDPSGARAKGIFDTLRESIDRSIENVARKLVAKGVWSEMKENAKLASDRAVPGYPQHGNPKPGGMVIMARELKKLKEEFGCDIHLVGHSAGSILFGHWLDELTKRDLPVESLTLYAPACTIEFANRHYIKACKKNIILKEKMFIHLMDDEREKADNVAVYKKSLLYLVSRALESIHKTPLLGMAAAWDSTYAKKNDIFNNAQYSEMAKWSKFANDIKLFTYNKSKSKVKTSRKNDYTNLAHGSFDNDINVIEETIKQIKGVEKLKFRVENLNGF